MHLNLSRFLVHVSYLEIYNEEVRDLLGKDPNLKLEVHTYTHIHIRTYKGTHILQYAYSAYTLLYTYVVLAMYTYSVYEVRTIMLFTHSDIGDSTHIHAYFVHTYLIHKHGDTYVRMCVL